jgi:hypothetical protein
MNNILKSLDDEARKCTVELILKSHHDEARKCIVELKEKIGDRKVLACDPISMSNPGQPGAVIQFDDESTMTYECNTFVIGCIQKALIGKVDEYLEAYVTDFEPT